MTTPTPPITTVLVANRGEIALRVMRTLRRLGIRCVAVYSDADADAPHVQFADVAVRLGPAPASQSYLDVTAVLNAARRTGADAIHPGYGFLSENVAFALACERAGITFIGPPPGAIEVMGDKIGARAAVVQHGVPVVPGISDPGLSNEALIVGAEQVGFPVLVKPSAGGGGKGMHRVDDPADLPGALETARREAKSSFGDDTLFIERFVERPRHIEVQILADRHGAVVHLGERECSLQRRHQKVIEEAPSPLLDPATRAQIGESACAAARSVNYVGAGTVEFIVSAASPGEFFFMEMNTRLQVEHPVTELVTGFDLVELQVGIAAGEPLPFTQEDVALTGHAIEARVYAEDPANGFLPTGGTVAQVRWPDDVRVDSGITNGTVVGTDYDPMLAKVIAHGRDRDEALARLTAALESSQVLGVGTNLGFLQFLLRQPRVRTGDLDTALLDESVADYQPAALPLAGWIAAAATRTEQEWVKKPAAQHDPWDLPNGWRLGGRAGVWSRFRCAGQERMVVIEGTPRDGRAWVGDFTLLEAPDAEAGSPFSLRRTDDGWRVTVDGEQQHWTVRLAEDCWVAGAGGIWNLEPLPLVDPRRLEVAKGQTDITSPMPGTVIAIPATDGAGVEAGQPLVIVEAMKMEHALKAPMPGRVEIRVKAGQTVKAGAVLAVVIPEGMGDDAGTD